MGAGISGIGMGCRMRMHHPERRFAILEARDAIGGTWDLFRYPGIRSDSDMYTFGYDFRPWKDERDIATGEAILDYLHGTVEEYRLGEVMRFGHRVRRLSWSSDDRRWTVEVHRASDDTVVELSCSFLVTCTGYYDYANGHRPRFPGEEGFEGTLVHPQHWPEDLETEGKRVVVIGSGATAVTLVPSLAKTAAHVTMLQRSPTWIFSRPAKDAIALKLKKVLPERAAYKLIKAKNIGGSWFLWHRAKTRPDAVRAYLRGLAADALGDAVDVDVHFNPSYDPWDQRLCLIPDDDLWEALKSDRASVVTDTIERFTPTGIELSSGAHLDADIVVTATGLKLQFLGGAELVVDGEVKDSSELVTYRGMMLGDCPNWAAIIGYTAASWTLKADLTADWVCRLLTYMDAHGYDTAVAALPSEPIPTESAMASLNSGYVHRAADVIPQRGLSAPWRNRDSYAKDWFDLRITGFDDGVLRYTRPHAEGAETPRRRKRDRLKAWVRGLR